MLREKMGEYIRMTTLKSEKVDRQVLGKLYEAVRLYWKLALGFHEG